MTNVQMLEVAIDNSGLKRKYIAEQLGLSYQGFLDKIRGKTEFVGSEIIRMRDLLRMDDQTVNDIFLSKE